MTIKVPLWIDVAEKPPTLGGLTTLEDFVLEWSPALQHEDLKFQEQLQALVDEVYEKGYEDGYEKSIKDSNYI